MPEVVDPQVLGRDHANAERPDAWATIAIGPGILLLTERSDGLPEPLIGPVVVVEEMDERLLVHCLSLPFSSATRTCFSLRTPVSTGCATGNHIAAQEHMFYHNKVTSIRQANTCL